MGPRRLGENSAGAAAASQTDRFLAHRQPAPRRGHCKVESKSECPHAKPAARQVWPKQPPAFTPKQQQQQHCVGNPPAVRPIEASERRTPSPTAAPTIFPILALAQEPERRHAPLAKQVQFREPLAAALLRTRLPLPGRGHASQ